MPRVTLAAALASVLFAGAIFGFFYAWTVSTLWGLDAADPRLAIGAMQAMNAGVRNAAFAPAFFATPLVLILTAALAARQDAWAGAAFAGGGMVYGLGGLMLTLAVNVPMNEALAATPIPDDPGLAAAVWQGYSARWQAFNQARMWMSGLALLLAALGLWRLGATGPAVTPWRAAGA
jgi:uncharacterized membrane protein